MKTGLVATKSITDATPAAFSSHAADRNYEDYIAEQQLAMGVDVLLGGGLEFFANRSDVKDLIAGFQEKGYSVVYNSAQLDQVQSGPVVGLFYPGDLPYVLDREYQEITSIPYLPQMTTKALQLLSQAAGDEGFFLMVEGSKIDIAGHRNDAASQVRETLEYDEALGVVLEFARKNGDTTVICTSDHETGGLTLAVQPNPFVSAAYSYIPQKLNQVLVSSDYLTQLVKQGANVNQIFLQYANITDLTADEIALISTANTTASSSTTSGIIGKIVSLRAEIGWTTQGHSGVDVNLYGYGLTLPFSGNMDNVALATYISEVLGLNLAAETAKLKDFSPYPPPLNLTRKNN